MRWPLIPFFSVYNIVRHTKNSDYMPRRGGSNEYPQAMFWGKNMDTPALLYKSGVQGYIHAPDMFS